MIFENGDTSESVHSNSRTLSCCFFSLLCSFVLFVHKALYCERDSQQQYVCDIIFASVSQEKCDATSNTLYNTGSIQLESVPISIFYLYQLLIRYLIPDQ